MSDDQHHCSCSEGQTLQDVIKATRRDFLVKLGIGLNAIAGACIGIPLLGYAASSFIKKFELKWISLGPLEQFPIGNTRMAVYTNPTRGEFDGDTANIPCWVRRIEAETFQVFAINCTHLGCPVRWFEESKLFMCPCHGGVFYQDGAHASGPPPRGLYEYSYKIENNELFVMAGQIPSLANPNP